MLHCGGEGQEIFVTDTSRGYLIIAIVMRFIGMVHLCFAGALFIIQRHFLL